MVVYGVTFCDPFPRHKTSICDSMKRLQPILNLPQNQILHVHRSEPAALRLQRVSFLDSVSRLVTRLPEQSTQEDAEPSESSGSHLEDTEEKGRRSSAATNEAHE